MKKDSALHFDLAFVSKQVGCTIKPRSMRAVVEGAGLALAAGALALGLVIFAQGPASAETYEDGCFVCGSDGLGSRCQGAGQYGTGSTTCHEVSLAGNFPDEYWNCWTTGSACFNVIVQGGGGGGGGTGGGSSCAYQGGYCPAYCQSCTGNPGGGGTVYGTTPEEPGGSDQ